MADEKIKRNLLEVRLEISGAEWGRPGSLYGWLKRWFRDQGFGVSAIGEWGLFAFTNQPWRGDVWDGTERRKGDRRTAQQRMEEGG